MNDYDFKCLNDKEFEILCCDLIGANIDRGIERFKPGKDAGVDGRYFISRKKEVVLQCKHWANTSFAQLLVKLEKFEKPKIEALKSARYILAVSHPLSRQNKKKIMDALHPYIKHEDDIYGKENLNDILRGNPQILHAHYKLWISNSDVLKNFMNNAVSGRSKFELAEITTASTKYVVTENHELAIKQLEKLGVVIITGEPGLGKTTLAQQLCLQYVAEGFEFVEIIENISDGEDLFVDPESKQIFYFDDFLGSNYLAAISGNVGSHIAKFIRRVQLNKKKRFVLTSRSTILNQGRMLIGAYRQNNLDKHEYELRMHSLTALDRAKILYNHIWFSDLLPEYVDQLYIEKRYLSITNHRNFNPRLISYVTDNTRLEDISARDYWSHIASSLENPADIWDHPYQAQLDDFGRALVRLVVVHGEKTLNEEVLQQAFNRHVALPQNVGYSGVRDFRSNIKSLTGSFFNRTVRLPGSAYISLFNPSIADYVLNRYKFDTEMFKHAANCIRTYAVASSLASIGKAGFISASGVKSIFLFLLVEAHKQSFSDMGSAYISYICGRILQSESHAVSTEAALKAAVKNIAEREEIYASEVYLDLIGWGKKKAVLSDDHILNIAHRFSDSRESCDDDFFSLLAKLIRNTNATYSDKENALEALSECLAEMIIDNFSSYCDVQSAIDGVGEYDYDTVEESLKEQIEEIFEKCGLPIDSSVSSDIANSYDFKSKLDQIYEEQDTEVKRLMPSPRPEVNFNESDAIDELFRR